VCEATQIEGRKYCWGRLVLARQKWDFWNFSAYHPITSLLQVQLLSNCQYYAIPFRGLVPFSPGILGAQRLICSRPDWYGIPGN
jgi:hypothetical protein